MYYCNCVIMLNKYIYIYKESTSIKLNNRKSTKIKLDTMDRFWFVIAIFSLYIEISVSKIVLKTENLCHVNSRHHNDID